MKRFALSIASLLSVSAPAFAGDLYSPAYDRSYYDRAPVVESERIIERRYYRAPVVERYVAERYVEPRVYSDIYYDDGYRYPRPRAYVYGPDWSHRHYRGW